MLSNAAIGIDFDVPRGCGPLVEAGVGGRVAEPDWAAVPEQAPYGDIRVRRGEYAGMGAGGGVFGGGCSRQGIMTVDKLPKRRSSLLVPTGCADGPGNLLANSARYTRSKPAR